MKTLMQNLFAYSLAIIILIGSLAAVVYAIALTWSVLALTGFEMLAGQTPTILKWIF